MVGRGSTATSPAPGWDSRSCATSRRFTTARSGWRKARIWAGCWRGCGCPRRVDPRFLLFRHAGPVPASKAQQAAPLGRVGPRNKSGVTENFGRLRSEEHTSELQSLIRISYDVLRFKKKNNY